MSSAFTKTELEQIAAQTRVDMNTTDAEMMVAAFINENAEIIARQIAADAKAAVPVVTGNLRRRIRARKSRYPDGGWIVQSTAPHAWLVEFGRNQGTVGKRPYLRPALDKNIEAAKQQFGAK